MLGILAINAIFFQKAFCNFHALRNVLFIARFSRISVSTFGNARTVIAIMRIFARAPLLARFFVTLDACARSYDGMHINILLFLQQNLSFTEKT